VDAGPETLVDVGAGDGAGTVGDEEIEKRERLGRDIHAVFPRNTSRVSESKTQSPKRNRIDHPPRRRAQR
jgi:hypothetical protein